MDVSWQTTLGQSHCDLLEWPPTFGEGLRSPMLLGSSVGSPPSQETWAKTGFKKKEHQLPTRAK